MTSSGRLLRAVLWGCQLRQQAGKDMWVGEGLYRAWATTML